MVPIGSSGGHCRVRRSTQLWRLIQAGLPQEATQASYPGIFSFRQFEIVPEIFRVELGILTKALLGVDPHPPNLQTAEGPG